MVGKLSRGRPVCGSPGASHHTSSGLTRGEREGKRKKKKSPRVQPPTEPASPPSSPASPSGWLPTYRRLLLLENACLLLTSKAGRRREGHKKLGERGQKGGHEGREGGESGEARSSAKREREREVGHHRSLGLVTIYFLAVGFRATPATLLLRGVTDYTWTPPPLLSLSEKERLRLQRVKDLRLSTS